MWILPCFVLTQVTHEYASFASMRADSEQTNYTAPSHTEQNTTDYNTRESHYSTLSDVAQQVPEHYNTSAAVVGVTPDDHYSSLSDATQQIPQHYL